MQSFLGRNRLRAGVENLCRSLLPSFANESVIDELVVKVELMFRREHESLLKYQATLGHKTCHSFTPNAFFDQLWHPR